MCVWVSVCVSPLKSTITFDPVDRVDWKFQGRQNLLRVSFWEVFWTPGPSDQTRSFFKWLVHKTGSFGYSHEEKGQVKNQRGCCLAKVFVALKKLNSSFRFFPPKVSTHQTLTEQENWFKTSLKPVLSEKGGKGVSVFFQTTLNLKASALKLKPAVAANDL